MTQQLNDQILAAYSAGCLPEAYALVVAAHLSLCDEARAEAEAWDAVGGAVLEDCAPSPMSEGALERALARIDQPPAAEPPAPAAAGPFPAPLAALVGGGPEAVRWRSIGGGRAQAILPTACGARARLMRIPAGTAIPHHTHRGIEMTLVLEGAFSDQGGRYARGDVELADESVHHTPLIDGDADCLWLTATDAPLRFGGLLPGLAAKIVRT